MTSTVTSNEVEFLCRDKRDVFIVVRAPSVVHPRELYVAGRRQHLILDRRSRIQGERVLTSEDDRFRFGNEVCTLNGTTLERLEPSDYDIVFEGSTVSVRQPVGDANRR
jgi:hypothetical protein